MTAVLFGTYDRDHSANRLLRLALAGAGWHVAECHEALWEDTRVKDGAYFGARSLGRLAARWAAAARRLAARWREHAAAAPLVVAGFGGQLDVLLARVVCRPRAGLVFAPLVSLSETLVEDRAVFSPGGLAARAVATLDRATLAAADLVLADTEAHAAYLRALGARHVVAWPLGVEPEFLAEPQGPPVARRVLFYGRHLPLHGVATIVAAAAELPEDVEVVLIGTGPARAAAEAAATPGRGARLVWRDDVALADLPGELGRAAVVLGVFGAGRKAAMVVPNKVWQAAAAGRPLVTRDGPALREVLVPGEHCLVCPPADARALAAAVRRLLDDPALGERLGRSARAHVLERYGPARQAARLGALLAERLGPAAGAAAAGTAAA